MTTTARYVQLSIKLREEIAAGKYDDTGRIPSLTALARQEGLSLSSVQRALDTLKHDGLIYTEPGRGIYIRRLS